MLLLSLVNLIVFGVKPATGPKTVKADFASVKKKYAIHEDMVGKGLTEFIG